MPARAAGAARGRRPRGSRAAHPARAHQRLGSLHSSGLITLASAAGLAAIIAACEAEDEMRGVLPLGATAMLEFRAPAHGRLVASCRLAEAARDVLRPVLAGAQKRARISTVAGSAPWPRSPTRRTRSWAAARSGGSVRRF